MRCLYCGKQLALFRRLTGSGEFCSDAHKQCYHDEYNRLAMTRLMAAQTKSGESRANQPSATLPSSPNRDVKGAKALPEPHSTRINVRRPDVWEPAGQARLQASTEPPAPAMATFLTRAVEIAVSEPPQILATPGESYSLKPLIEWPRWNPALVREDPPPAVAGPLPMAFSAAPSAPGELAPGEHPDWSVQSKPAFAFTVPPRPLAFRRELALGIEALEFAPRLVGQPASVRQFEIPRFAMVAMAIPVLPLVSSSIPPAQAPEFPAEFAPSIAAWLPVAPAGAAPAEPPPQLSPETITLAPASPLFILRDVLETRSRSAPGVQPRPPATETRRPSAVRVKLAAMAAAMPPEPPREGPALKPVLLLDPLPESARHQESAPAEPSAIPPPVTPIRRRPNPNMPSILDAPLRPGETETKSLWGSLRKYMKGE